MINEILRNNLIIREWVNGGLLPLNLSLVLVIGLFLWSTYRNTDNWSAFQREDGVQTACALWWIFLADAIRAGSAWSILNFRLGLVPPPQAAEIPVIGAIAWINAGFIIAGIIGLLASLRCIYLFTPPWLGHWYWVGSILVTFAFQIIT